MDTNNKQTQAQILLRKNVKIERKRSIFGTTIYIKIGTFTCLQHVKSMICKTYINLQRIQSHPHIKSSPTIFVMFRLFFFSIMAFFLAIPLVNGQTMTNDTQNNTVDSLSFRLIQDQLEGCWKTKPYQFRYNKDKNFGHEFKSMVYSSAPMFKLKIIETDIFLEWIELTGGESLQKIVSVNKSRLTVLNERGDKVVYKRNKDCK